jgi:hypothetical protein
MQYQCLWDRDLNQPVQYLGISIYLDGPSIWHVIENGAEKAYEFSGYEWWQSRYTHMRDGENPAKIHMGNTGPSQFYGGPFEDCKEIPLKSKG